MTNENWIRNMENQETELNEFMIKSMSHIINVHHRWNSRLFEEIAESGNWDILPIEYWMRFCEENYRQTVDFLEKNELNQKIKYHSEEGVQLEKAVTDILYHILNHSNYHRAQIAREMKLAELNVPSLNFIFYR